MLLAKQEKFLNTLCKYVSEKKYPPTLRELCILNKFKSTSTASRYLKLLQTEGYIKRDKKVNRGIIIIKSNI